MKDFTYMLTALVSYLFLGTCILTCMWGLCYSLYKKRYGLAFTAAIAMVILLFILWNVLMYIKSGFNG